QDNHEDLTGKIFFPDAASAAENNPASYHGTHVAGIMGATPNNNKGVTGILWDTNMYCVNWNITGGTDANLFAGLTETVQAGAKVVNFSLGLNSDISGSWTPETNPTVISYAHQSEAVMTPLLNAGYDFIVCESAGNGQGGKSVDAIYNGYFCSVTNTNLLGTPEMITKINERIIVVGSAERTGTLAFTQSPTSNAGSQVDICAPGVSVYSCYDGGAYGYLSGTSMASPMAAAIAALTWSVNPNLTGAQVRSIVLNPLNTPYTVADNTSSTHPLTNSYKMVNAKKSVEAALATIPPVYTAVNAAVSAANALDSSLYTAASWLELTSALNAVDYSLLYINQPQIDIMAQNINTAIASLVLKPSSATVFFDLNGGIGTVPTPQTGYTGSPISMPAQGDIAKQFYNFLGWATTQGSSIALASYAIPAANATLYAVWSKIPVTMGIQAGSTTVIYQTNHFIYGLKAGLTQIEFERDFIKLNGNSRLEYTPDSEILGTNTKIDLIDNETLAIVETFHIVIFGDVNGDSNIDSLDAGIIVDFQNSCMPWDPIADAAFIKAGDVNNEGNVDSIDAGLVVDTENSYLYINQVTGTAS
ncbi:MAG: S8 family serine peptidase, partial [Eubacteriales bacterium]